jgi:thiamine kinase
MVTPTPGQFLGSGREAVVYALDDDRVLKVFRDVGAGGRALAEYTTALMLHAHGLPVAMPLEVTQWDGHPALVSRRIGGRDLNAALAAAPWKVAAVARLLAEVQVAWHRHPAPSGLPSVHSIVETRLLSNTAIAVPLVDAALSELSSLPAGDRICHGNLHLGNVLVEGGSPVVVDCSDASQGDPMAEVAHTLVRYHCATLRPDAPILARTGEVQGRLLLRWLYLRAYRRSAGLDADLVRRWVAVRAVERLAENNAPERRRLLGLAGPLLPAAKRR